jgi:ATP-dependent Clp protease ATP-binding subunit ClpA
VMTTNAGASEASRASIGFKTQDHSSDAMAAIRKLFTPEFRNRLDAIIQFNGLDRQTILSVVDKFLFELEQQLEEKHVTLSVDAAVKEWLAERGYDPQMGARPMARVIQEEIKKPLADELLFGRLARGGRLQVSVAEGKLSFEIEEEAVH